MGYDALRLAIAGHHRLTTPKPFPDRRERLFGRERDLEALCARVRLKGLTAVAARPQMGKSWLLTDLARRLSQDHEPRHLVGFAESAGETPDLLLRTVIDLYTRWLSDAGYWQQAKMVWDQQKRTLLPGVAKTVTKIFKEIAGKVAKPVAVAVEDAINGLIAADEKLKTGGVQLPTLSYEQARDLVAAVAQISDRPIALFLDQWEKSPDVGREAKALDAFIRHPDDWAHCHVFLALRPDEPAYDTVKKLEASLRGPVKIHSLEHMQLADSAEQARLLRYVQREVAAAARADDQTLLDLVGGYPGVLYQWTNPYQRVHMRTGSDLERVAADAQAYRFSELDDLLPTLSSDQRKLAIRLALLPGGGAPVWDAIKVEVLDGLDAGLIDDLCLLKVLESAAPPGFGHAKRWEMAKAWFLKYGVNGVRAEAAALIPRLAAPIRDTAPAVEPNAMTLFSLLPLARDLNLGNLPLALCQAAACLFDAVEEVDNALLLGAKQAEAPRFEALAPLLAMCLFSTLDHAKAEQDLARRDGLLAELRALGHAHPEDAVVRLRLAMGLFTTLNHAKAEQNLMRRDGLLEELRALGQAHPEDAAMREWLGKGLFATLSHAEADQNLVRRDGLLEELRALATAHPEDAAVREWLGKGLVNTLIDARAAQDLARRDGLLEEVRVLAQAHPEDAAVREVLASGLFNTLDHAKAEQNLARRNRLLDELRALGDAHPEDAAVRELLAWGLFNTLNDAKAEQDLARRNRLLSKLRALAQGHPEDAAVREWLAKGLVNTLYHATDEQDLARRNRLLAKLRALAQAHPEDVAVREQLAMGLVNALNLAEDEQDLARRDGLLDELRALARAHSEDAAVRLPLAMRLAKTMLDAKGAEKPELEAALRMELLALAEAHPEDGWVEQFRSAGLL